MTKIEIISGFLGAGKTTFIQKMLKEAFAGQQVVLIENEFGEIGIDGGFLQDAGIEIKEMNSGCICCSLVGDFGNALQEVVDTYHPDRVLIEPSGVGKLSDVIRAVQNVQGKVQAELGSCVTVVDVTKCKIYHKNFGEFFANQIAWAGTIVLSRTDKASQEQIAESTALIRQLNARATLVTTPLAQLDGKELLAVIEGGDSLEQELLQELRNVPQEEHHHHHGEEEHHHHHGEEEHHHHHGEEEHHGHHHEEEHHGHHHEEEHHGHHHEEEHHGHHHEEEHHGHHHHADDIFVSWGMETVNQYDEAKVKSLLEALENQEYGQVLRAKGMVRGTGDEWVYFDMVPGEYDIRTGSPQYTGRICVIGAALNEKKLQELFA